MVERIVRAIAGTFVIASVVLSQIHHPYWLFFTLFVGANLLQSSFTQWCPLEMVLEKFIKDDREVRG